MPQIDTDFDVWKALTAKRSSEIHSYNEVLRELLGLPVRLAAAASSAEPARADGKLVGGRFLPDGTKLRARYKGRIVEAEIREGQLIDAKAVVHSSASAAARAVTGGTFNGLIFWEAKRPGDAEWRKIVALPKQP